MTREGKESKMDTLTRGTLSASAGVGLSSVVFFVLNNLFFILLLFSIVLFSYWS